MSADEMVTVELNDGNIGEHPIVIRDQKTQKSHNYGYRRTGETFLMLRSHAQMYPNKFTVQEKVVEKKKETTAAPATSSLAPPVALKVKPTAEPTATAEPTTATTTVENWQEWGMTEKQAAKLEKAGVTTAADLSKLSATSLRDTADMSENMAEKYLERAKKK